MKNNRKTMSVNVEQYLNILGLKPAAPDYEFLAKLVYAHLTKIPFENLSKLYYLRAGGLKSLPALTQYLDGIEQLHFGGTCYSNNYHLYLLLKFLDFDVSIHGADMNKPDVHLVIHVKINGRVFMVDAGYAAPFLEPIPTNLERNYRVTLGSDQYVFNPQDANGRTRLTLYRNGEKYHGYVVNPKPKRIENFSSVITNSFHPEATFMNSLLLVRFNKNFSKAIHNMEYIESKGNYTKKNPLKTVTELTATIEEKFGIPQNISNTALQGMNMSKTAWN